MSPEQSEPRVSASPYSTGGGGTRFEHRLGALFLTRLLTEGSISELAERAPSQVAFQQSHTTTVDDFVITASAPDDLSSVRLEVAVRRQPKFTRSHTRTQELIAALLKADIAAEKDPNPEQELRLAVAVSGSQNHAHDVAALAVAARSQPDADAFFEVINTPGRFAASGRLTHVRGMVEAALDEIDESEAGPVEHRCWSLLRRLWILELNLEAENEADWTALIDTLKPVAVDHSREKAVALRDRLDQLSAELARNAGVADLHGLRRRLHGVIDPEAHMPLAGWSQISSLDQEARAVVARSLAGKDPASELVFPRTAARQGLQDAIVSAGELIVTGESGIGKSALVMDVIESAELGGETQAIAVNLRHLPTNQQGLLSLLHNPLDELFSELTAPERLLIIDGAEAAAENHREVFSHLLHCARRAELKVVVTSTTERAAVTRELMKAGAVKPTEYAVPGLTDDEIDEVVAHFPGVRRLANNTRARELLRRPIVVDLLVRAGDPAVLINDSEALAHIWQHLVRNGERRDAGVPEAREQAMLHLAAHSVQEGSDDALLSNLDHDAVAGLRQSGVLLPPSRMPWERVPAFKHDLVRAYSIARWLLRDRNPVEQLEAVGVPRWTLPSARLACEIVLSAPDEPSYPVSGRFAQLQAGFEEIAAAGHGDRWADVPTEALLSVSNSDRLLDDAWADLMSDEGQGVARIIRILNGRHKSDGFLDALVAEPVIALLIKSKGPHKLSRDVEELIRDWLQRHVLQGTPEGQPTRTAVRQTILAQCAENERVLDERDAARRAKLAARTHEEIAQDEAHLKQVAATAPLPPFGRRRRRTAASHLPYEWINDSQIEQLALLGEDLDVESEKVLRRIAEDAPSSLAHAVEPFLAGNSLASHDFKLLIDLAEAYYIDEDDDDFAWSGGLHDDGIRRHQSKWFGAPLASFLHGPFLAMFRANYRGGVAFLNRMLNHAARCRVRIISDLDYGLPTDDPSDLKFTFSITGERRDYVGDGHVWVWYRGSGVGPYPCMSALQALEFATEEYIRAGMPPAFLTQIMLEDAENLAMPALALGELVRHLETAGSALDPYLVEPAVWSLEFSRVVSETSGLASRDPELGHPERRGWSLREVSTVLAWAADETRAAQLKAVGEQLLSNALLQVGDESSPEAQHHLAAVRTWADSLDRDMYETHERGDQLVVQQTVNPDAERVLGETNADLRRSSGAMDLVVRHAYGRDKSGRAPDIAVDVLVADLAIARDLLEDPPQSGLVGLPDGPVAAAASAVELHLTGRVEVPDEQLQWSTEALLKFAASLAEHAEVQFDDSLFSQGADRSVARVLPFLLLPNAAELRRACGVEEPDDLDALITLSCHLASRSANEARLAYARGLDAVWGAPCDTSHLLELCHHRFAIDIVIDSFLESAFGPRDSNGNRTMERLDPPAASSLDGVDAANIYIRQLTPALRAAGSAAISNACCKNDAQQMLEPLLSAHQRGMLAFNGGYHHSDSDSLVAARAALWQAIDGRDNVLLACVERYLPDARLLAEFVRAIAVAGEEREEAGQQARRLWPRIMDRVLDYEDANGTVFSERTWGDYAEGDLIPTPSLEQSHLTSEVGGDPYRWRDLLSWSSQVDRWVETIHGSRMSIDNLVRAVRELDLADQTEQGLRWIERIVERCPKSRASTFTLPEWLRERRSDLTTDAQIARWQRVVDLLVVSGDSRVTDLAD